jgi:hypothetical protein
LKRVHPFLHHQNHLHHLLIAFLILKMLFLQVRQQLNLLLCYLIFFFFRFRSHSF